jgi:hypothetical protein
MVFLAAAAGGRQQAGPAALLAQAIPPAPARTDPGAWYDLVARHGLVSAVVTALDGAGPVPGIAPGGATPAAPATSATTAPAPRAASGGDNGNEEDPAEPLPELLLSASPLTAVLYRPPLRALRSNTTGQAVTTTVALLGRPRGQAVLAAGLAGWTPHPEVLNWRATLLSRLRHEHLDLLLDVYLMARTRFAADWDRRIPWAAAQLSLRGTADQLALATLRFWAPLSAVERSVQLSALRPLLSRHDRAVALVRRFRLDQTGG